MSQSHTSYLKALSPAKPASPTSPSSIQKGWEGFDGIGLGSDYSYMNQLLWNHLKYAMNIRSFLSLSVRVEKKKGREEERNINGGVAGITLTPGHSGGALSPLSQFLPMSVCLSKLSFYHTTSFIFKVMIPKPKPTISFQSHVSEQPSFLILETTLAMWNLLRNTMLLSNLAY